MYAHQLRLILATLLAALLFPIASTARPNIIIVITDDQGYPEMSAHGNPKLQTPAMDRMHREGVRLENFHVDPTCAPTRAALMSGRPAFYCGVTHTILERERMRPGVQTLPEAFYDRWWTGARKHMVNEDGNLDQPNPFHVMFHEQQNRPEPKIVSKDRWMAKASKKAKPKKGKKSAK